MIERDINPVMMELAKQFPIVTITGPRQSGKTTLSRMAFPDKPYVSLEDKDVLLLAQTDPRQFLAKYCDGAIFDEIQRAPDLLSYLQTIVDNDKRKGLFILTGSHQLMLQQSISQSLAGRTALLSLLPLSINELKKTDAILDLDTLLLNGFYPAIHQNKVNPTFVYKNYIATYLERDVRQLTNIKDLSSFQRFLKLCAGRVGQILNKNSLASDVGVSSTTIEHWLSILEASYIIFRLQPYFENFGKRVIKSPKLYFTDPGLAAYLLNIENISQISRDPLRGNLVENLIILDLIKYRYNRGLDHNLYFYRDQHQNEVDVIYKTGEQLIPIEIKAAQTIIMQFFKGLKHFTGISKNKCALGYLIYSGSTMQDIESYKIINYLDAHQIFTS
jgi:uncharacterized protein